MDEWEELGKLLDDEEPRDYLQRIASNPAVLVGKPVIRGPRISVELILEWLSGNLDLDEFFAAYPHLAAEDVRAALLFARDAVRASYLESEERKDALTAPD
jgi:uncharacterized protein (DUF433 family)